MVFNLFSAPCFGAIGAMRRELGSTKNLLKAVLFQTGMAWVLATIVYQVGSRLTGVNPVNIILICIILLAIILIIRSMIKHKDEGCSGCPHCKSCGK